jgi:hypothetical protein
MNSAVPQVAQGTTISHNTGMDHALNISEISDLVKF